MRGEGREGDFQTFEILTASMLCSANLRHHDKFRADRSNHCGDMAVFHVFKMVAVRYLRFLKVGNINCPYSSEANVRHRARFRADQSSRCECMAVYQFLKMAAVRAGRSNEIWLFFGFLKMDAVRHLGFLNVNFN